MCCGFKCSSRIFEECISLARHSEVDAWCLGWSCFYLLTAQSLFATADPKEPDADWLTFRRGDVRARDRTPHDRLGDYTAPGAYRTTFKCTELAEPLLHRKAKTAGRVDPLAAEVRSLLGAKDVVVSEQVRATRL